MSRQRLQDRGTRRQAVIVGGMVSTDGVQATMRPRAEETGLCAAPILAAAVGRIGCSAGHVTIAILGTTLLMAVPGGAAGWVLTGHGSRPYPSYEQPGDPSADRKVDHAHTT